MNKVLDWLVRAELPTGGIAAWQMPNGAYHSVYVEITGYCLPTLIRWKQDAYAIRCGNWLLGAQNPDGSFNGLDGIPRPFDTSAVVEGLEALYRHTGTAIYRAAANRAVDWMRQQITPDGYLKNSVHNVEPCIYNLRASAIIGNAAELEYWQGRGLIDGQARSHYLAYALEGALNFGAHDFALDYIQLAYNSGNYLMPFNVTHDYRPIYADFDMCATAQMALLFRRVGLDASRHYDALSRYVTDDGGVPQSNSDARKIAWAAKFYLDLVADMEGVE